MLPLAGMRLAGVLGELLLLGIELALRLPPELTGLAIRRALTVLLLSELGLLSVPGLLSVLGLLTVLGLPGALPIGLARHLWGAGPLPELALLGWLPVLRLLWLLGLLTLPGLLVQSSAGWCERIGAALGLCPADRARSCRALLVLVGLTR